MITPSKYYDGDKYMAAQTYYGLSTDTKPTTVPNGSFFIAIDNIGATDELGNPLNCVYCFDAENSTWYPEESEGT